MIRFNTRTSLEKIRQHYLGITKPKRVAVAAVIASLVLVAGTVATVVFLKDGDTPNSTTTSQSPKATQEPAASEASPQEEASTQETSQPSSAPAQTSTATQKEPSQTTTKPISKESYLIDPVEAFIDNYSGYTTTVRVSSPSGQKLLNDISLTGLPTGLTSTATESGSSLDVVFKLGGSITATPGLYFFPIEGTSVSGTKLHGVIRLSIRPIY